MTLICARKGTYLKADPAILGYTIMEAIESLKARRPMNYDIRLSVARALYTSICRANDTDTLFICPSEMEVATKLAD